MDIFPWLFMALAAVLAGIGPVWFLVSSPLRLKVDILWVIQTGTITAILLFG